VIFAFTSFIKTHHLTFVVYNPYTNQSRISDTALRSTRISYKIFKDSVHT